MRIIVLSDSHRNRMNVRRIVERHQKDGDLFLFLGDGEDDFLEVMQDYPHLSCDHVRGNCDFGSLAPSFHLIKADGKKIFFTHGHDYHVKFGLDELLYAAQGRKANVVLYGHTHQPNSEYVEGMHVVNPGSCSGSALPPTYAIVDVTKAGIVPVLVDLNGNQAHRSSLWKTGEKGDKIALPQQKM